MDKVGGTAPGAHKTVLLTEEHVTDAAIVRSCAPSLLAGERESIAGTDERRTPTAGCVSDEAVLDTASTSQHGKTCNLSVARHLNPPPTPFYNHFSDFPWSYDTIRWINVRSKADGMASLTERTAQKR